MVLGGIALAIGIGLQNFPEGLAVAMPLRREGMGRFKAFLYGLVAMTYRGSSKEMPSPFRCPMV